MTVDVAGLDDLVSRLEGLRDAAMDLRPVLEPEAEIVDASITASWSGRMSPGGDIWTSNGDGGSMVTAHRVTADERSLAIKIAHHAASYVVWGTQRMPPRNPLPVQSAQGVLSLDMRGRAGSLWRRHVSRIEAYLAGQDGDDIR